MRATSLCALRLIWVSSAGSEIGEFERRFAQYTGMSSACACQSGTAGLHLCLRHFGIGQNDIVIVPTLTFIATINSVMYQAAEPVFIDCNEHLCLSVNQLLEYIETRCNFDGEQLVDKYLGKRVKAIMPVHIFGETCDMDGIMDIATRYHLVVIEDATEALVTLFESGKFKGQHAGTVGHAGVYSFNGNKIITTGGGGMVVANSGQVVDHVRYLSQQAKDDQVYFVHNEVGYNYRMTNLQACLGLAQLEQLPSFIKTKRRNYSEYRQLLKVCSFATLLEFKAFEDSNCWFYSLVLATPSATIRDKLIKVLDAEGIQTRPIWRLNHLQEPFKKFYAMPCPQAESWYDRIINLPCSTNLTLDEVQYIAQKIVEFPMIKE